ncbi:Transaldolase [Rhodospirillaceae bacterium LM-1]|nr:Transaldolase [Rhodospirillaceae bacterium LM-1]
MTASLTIKLYMDGAEIDTMKRLHAEGSVQGFTTNPTLMRKAGVSDYEKFAREAIAAIPDLPLSFEVFSDDIPDMEREARKIASWGGNTFIKVPITNTRRESTVPMIKKLAQEGFRLNVTAILTLDQVRAVADALNADTPAIVSVFAGRIADTGRDPMPIMRESAALLKGLPKAELLWASTREFLNLYQAQDAGCHIITVPPDILSKRKLAGSDLDDFSLDTVKMFFKDATQAGFSIL